MNVPREPSAGTQEAARFLRYLVAGAVAAAANYGSRFGFSVWVPFEVAVVLAFVVGLCTGFHLMRQYAFEAHHGPIRDQAAKYLAVNLLALAQTLVISSLLARWLLPWLGVMQHREALAHAVGVAVPVLTSYFGHRLATFK